MQGTSVQYETGTVIGTSLQYETGSVIGTSVQYETGMVIRTFLQYETGTVIGTFLQHESGTAVGTSLQHGSGTVIGTSLQYETGTAIGTSLQHESGTVIGTSQRYGSVTVVETSLQFSLVCRNASLHLKVRRLQRSVLTGSVVFNKKYKVSLQLEVWRLRASLQMEVWRLQAALSRFQKHLYMWKRDVYMWQRHVSKGISTDGSVTFASASLQLGKWRLPRHLYSGSVTCSRTRLFHKWKNDVHKSISYPRTCGFAKGIDAHGTVTFTKQNKNHVRWICDVLKRMMSAEMWRFQREVPSLYSCMIGCAWLSRRWRGRQVGYWY